MGTKLFVGGLPWSTTDEELSNLFANHGEVVSAKVVSDRETGRSRGFGFVEMADDASAQAAISALEGDETLGRAIAVSEARPKE